MNTRHLASEPPPRKEGWDHTEQVLVYYEANLELGLTAKWGIAYYHYNPPFFEEPKWIDFHNHRTPTLNEMMITFGQSALLMKTAFLTYDSMQSVAKKNISSRSC